MSKALADNESVTSMEFLPCPPYRGSEPYIYVCYAHCDYHLVSEEIKRLNGLGYNVCYDEGIIQGDDWIQETAEVSRTVLPLLICSSFSALVMANFM